MFLSTDTLLDTLTDSGASDPTDETRQGVPLHFQATLDQLEQLYDGLQLHYGNERLGKKKWKLK